MISRRKAKKIDSVKPVALLIAFTYMFAVLSSAPIQAQDARYTNSQYGISFQPPPGWTEDKTIGSDVLVQYLGPERADKTRSVINLAIQNSVVDLSDSEVNALVASLPQDFNGRGLENARVTGHRKIAVSGFDSLAMDIVYNQERVPMHLRQVYVPVSEQNRTYLFTFVDTAEHFNESASTVDAAINSFSPGVSRPLARSRSTPNGDSGAGAYTLLLVVVGSLALIAVIGAIYLLLQRRASA